MTPSHRLHRLAGAALCALALGACSTVPTKPAGPAPLADTMARAAAAESAGQVDQAITLWKQAAAAYPTEKAPWAEIAQTRFDSGQYGEAIVGAQEILVRDPNDQLGNSIIAISGLRLATRSLADLSRQNNLSGSLRTESQDLARLLRESLGEQVLVPPARARGASGGATSTTVKPPATRRGGKQSTSANPFDALK